MRCRQLIVKWLMANTQAIDMRRREGKTYYVMPRLEAVTDVDGVVTDVVISHPLDFTAQMLDSAATRDLR